MKMKLYGLFVIIVLLLFSCASLNREVYNALYTSDYLTARKLLEEKGVGEVLKNDPNEKELAARNSFQEKVEQDFFIELETLLAEGKLFDGIDLMKEAIQLCPWSEKLHEKLSDLNVRVKEVKDTEERWINVDETTFKEIVTARNYIDELELISPDYKVSDYLKKVRRQALGTIVGYWNNKFNDLNDSKISIFYEEGMFEDLQISDFNEIRNTKFYMIFRKISDGTYFDDKEFYVKCAEAYAKEEKTFAAYVTGKGLYSQMRSESIKWFKKNLVNVFSDAPTYAVLNNIEIINNHLLHIPDFDLTEFNESRIKFFVQAARNWSGQSTASMLSLLYLQHIYNIEGEKSIGKYQDIYKSSIASLGNSEDLNADLYINARANVESWEYELIRLAIYNEVQNRSSNYFSWHLKPENSLNSKNRIDIIDVTFETPDLNNLIKINSKYLSHYEDVPNSYKNLLKIQLNQNEFQVNQAKRNYEWAVNNYNLNPTNWTLNAANNAYNTYQNAINQYNQMVDLYNMTPDTVSQPVYLTYSFRQGNLKIGWEITVKVVNGDQEEFITSSKILNDFVRIGAKRSDSNESYRLNDQIDIDTSFDTSIGLLYDAISEICDGITYFVEDSINIKFGSNLTEDESRLLKWMINPWKSVIKENSWPSWVMSAADNIEVPELEPKPAEIYISNSRNYRPNTNDIESLSNSVVPNIVLIESINGDGSVGFSSGAIISNDGLILTCAHGLPGNEIKVLSEMNNEEYSAEIVYVDNKNDVAVIKAKGMNIQTWLNVDLSRSVERGEKVIALGNPSLGDRTFAINALTIGSVAVPEQLQWGSPRIVADITIASGSSGGPLISMKDGSIIGVVVAISSPEFGNQETGRSASGMFALVAPSKYFSEWVGLIK